PPSSPPFPYTTLFRSAVVPPPLAAQELEQLARLGDALDVARERLRQLVLEVDLADGRGGYGTPGRCALSDHCAPNAKTRSGIFRDRKSTRLNSSHVSI